MNYILFSNKISIGLYKNDINNLLETNEIDYELYHVLNDSGLNDILLCAIKWNGFIEIPEKDFIELELHQKRIRIYKNSIINQLNNTCQNNFNDST